MREDSPRISVVIPVKNKDATICECLRAVLSQEVKPLEVIVVDGHSTDKTVEEARRFQVKIITEDYGTIGGARQVGLENSNMEFVAFTDADCIPEAAWLKNLIKEFDDDVVGVGGAIRNVGEGIWEKSIAHVMNTFVGSANSVQGRLFENKRFVRSISGCNSIYYRQALEKIGGFDVSLSINEDTEINMRIAKIGRLRYTPDAVVSHKQGRSLKDFARRMYKFGEGRGKLRLPSLQCIPPVMALLLFVSLAFTHWAFVFAVFIYIFILIAMGVIFAIQETSFRYLISIPIIYLVEHCSYSLGFWKGLLDAGVRSCLCTIETFFR